MLLCVPCGSLRSLRYRFTSSLIASRIMICFSRLLTIADFTYAGFKAVAQGALRTAKIAMRFPFSVPFGRLRSL